MYIFLLSSRNVIDVFIIVFPALPFERKCSFSKAPSLQRSYPAFSQLWTTPRPFHLLCISCHLIALTFFRPFLSGVRRASPVTPHILVAMLSLSTPPVHHFRISHLSERRAALAQLLKARPLVWIANEAIQRSSYITAWQLAHLAEQGFIHRFRTVHFFPARYLTTTTMTSFTVGGTFIYWTCSSYLDTQ